MPPENPPLKESRSIKRKNELRQDLLNRDINSIENKASTEKNILRTLSSLLYDGNPLIRWRAIEALGRVSGIIAVNDLDKIRRQIRRILWLMNDESGGLCWYGPEAIGEILFNIPALISEYSAILETFLAEEPFEAGSRRAIARVAGKNPEAFYKSVGLITESLKDPDSDIRAASIKALIAIGHDSARKDVEMMKDDLSIIEHYDFGSGELRTATVSELAGKYMDRTGKIRH